MGGDPEQLEGIRKTLNLLLENPGTRQWLEEVETDWRPEFAKFVANCAEVYDWPDHCDTHYSSSVSDRETAEQEYSLSKYVFVRIAIES